LARASNLCNSNIFQKLKPNRLVIEQNANGQANGKLSNIRRSGVQKDEDAPQPSGE
jgi:hypothetical protein